MHDGLMPVSEGDLLRFPPQPKIRLAPVFIRYLDHELRCWVQRPIGIRASCSCGADSGRQKSWAAARDWKLEHAASAHADVPVTIAGPLGDRPEVA